MLIQIKRRGFQQLTAYTYSKQMGCYHFKNLSPGSYELLYWGLGKVIKARYNIEIDDTHKTIYNITDELDN